MDKLKRNLSIVFLLLVALAVLLGSSVYTLHETKQAVITQFGKLVGDEVTTAGLHFKLPFVQKVHLLDKRILSWDGDVLPIPTKDKLFIQVDTFARWRIKNPQLYYERLRDEASAQSRLDGILDGETRNAIAKQNLLEVIRTTNREPMQSDQLTTGEQIELQTIAVGRQKVTREILLLAAPRLEDLGIELLDVRFKRINYSPDVQAKIYERMISERQQIAQRFRSEGQGEAARIIGKKEKELLQIQSGAYRKIQEIEGDADATATEIYANAYGQDAEAREFYQFQKTMETYVETLDKDVILLLSTEGDFFKYLKGIQPSTAP